MLNRETNFRQGNGELNSPVTSQIEVAAYIENLASELQELSQKSGLTMLSYLLSMVVLSAGEIGAEARKPEMFPGGHD